MHDAPPRKPSIALTAAHVARVAPGDGPLHTPGWRMLEDHDLDLLAERLTRDRPRPIPVFAYGSLIWKPEVEHLGHVTATAHGWHRRFCMQLTRWRGTAKPRA